MKKLMIAAALVCATVCAQAASVTWGSGTITKPGELDATSGTYKFLSTTKSSNKVGDAATAYLWLVEVGDYGTYTSQSEIYDALWSHRKDTEGDFKPTKTGQSASSVTSLKTEGHAKGETVYGLILWEYSDGVDTYYVAQKGTGTIGSVSETGDDATVSSMLKGGVGTNAFSNVGWTKVSSGDVPEPTSAMLLLLGVAGLALKRKIA